MNKLYTGVLPNKLVDELQAAGLLEREKMSFHNDGTDWLEIRFNNIKEVYTDILEGEEVVNKVISGYEKQVSTQVTIPATEEEPERVETVTESVEYTAEFESFLAEIQAIVDVHDPTPYPVPDPNLTLGERMDQLELAFLQSEGVI